MAKKQKTTKKRSEAERKKQSKQTTIFFGVAIYVILLYFALHLGHAMVGETDLFGNKTSAEGSIMTYLYDAVETASTTPMDFLPFTTEHVKCIFVITLIYGICVAFYYLNYLRYYHEREGETCGTSEWNEDYEGFAEKYSTVPPKQETKKKGKNDVTPPVKVDMNLLFTEKNRLSFDNKKTKRNSNVIILGGSGTGKSFSYIKPNIAQSNSSFVITDPSGEIYRDMNKFLIDEGYSVKVLNLQYYERGNHYNPFDYLRRKEDGSVDQSSVMSMVCSFLNNADGNNAKEDAFWRSSAEALFCAAAFYLIEMRPYKEWKMRNVSQLIRAARRDDSDTSSETAFDVLMKEAGKKNKNSMAYSFYQTFKLASNKTAESILVSTDVKLSKFSIPEIDNLTTTDLDNIDNNINLNTIGDTKTALFIITQTGGGPADFLCSMLYTQLFDILYDRAGVYCPSKYHVYSRHGYPVETMLKSEDEAKAMIEKFAHCSIQEEHQNDKTFYYIEDADGKPVMRRKPAMNPDLDQFYHPKKVAFDTRAKAESYLDDWKGAFVKQTNDSLPWSVTCLLDEFNNINEIPKFDQILATCRKYNINISIVLQNLAQLKSRYKDAWNTILGNCDNFLFLGSSELETCKYVSDILGEGTILTKSASRGSGDIGKANYSFSEKARKLLDPTELARLDNSECIYVMRGELPFKTNKLNFATHPNFIRTGCGNEKYSTSEAEMKLIFAKKAKKVRRKRHVNPIAEKQRSEKIAQLHNKQDVMESVGAFTEAQAKEAVKPEKPKVPNNFENAASAAKAEVKLDENGAETWMFQ